MPDFNLRQALDCGKLADFIAEHEGDDPGDADLLNATVAAMAGKSKAEPGASSPEHGDD
jgi:hypothetical protein